MGCGDKHVRGLSCISALFRADTHIAVSFAYILVVQFGRSVMYIIKRSGPRMLPCRTPAKTGWQSDTEPLMQAISALFSWYEDNHFKDMSEIPRCNFSRKCL